MLKRRGVQPRFEKPVSPRRETSVTAITPQNRTETYQISDRVTAESGIVAMTGIQAVVRIPLDQKRADEAKGQNTAGLVSGYRGSPVGGVDESYEQGRATFESNNIKFISGVNEDLGATAIWGSQQASLDEAPLYDGVVGLWYGKGPGVDRSGDALRHANTSGVNAKGGVLAVAGDDPACKSSTVASASEFALADLAMPTLYPSSVQDVLDFGRFGYELSRFCGSWVGFKIHTNVADAYSTVNLDPTRLSIIHPEFLVDGVQWSHQQSATLIDPISIRLEAEMFGPRLDAARVFSATNGFDRLFGSIDEQGARAKIGLLCAGPLYGELRDALTELGFSTDADLAKVGIRIYKPAVVWPLGPDKLEEFAEGLEEIFVLEEKRGFIETQVRDLLYGRHSAPRVLGKRDDEGRPLLPQHGGLLVGDLVKPLRQRLGRFIPADRFARERVTIPVAIAPRSDEAMQTRGAYFCSGCPHNRSTVLPDGSSGHGGIGCHAMALNMDRDLSGLTHMGAEGAQWVGLSPFVADTHRFQNLGDGTFAHSGSLAIRQAVSAGTNITYKILFNGTVAMTGGQDAAGEIAVPALTRWLDAESVTKTVVVADDPKKYPADAHFAKGIKVVHRDKLDDVQRELRDIPGVTVIIYDQACAAELRRGRKRGTFETPTTRVMINEDICEGCGDCGDVSNCASVHPVHTPFGRKTQIHQESCNYDLTCLKGNCPAFVTVEIDPADGKVTKSPDQTSALVAELVAKVNLPPEPVSPAEANLLLLGIGGTGVVTVNQIIGTAALMDGKFCNGLDQTGLAQKGGSVVSNLRISAAPVESSNRVATGGADTLLVFDLLTAVKNLDRLSPERTTAVVSTGLVPTGNMASGRASDRFPELDSFKAQIDPTTRAEDNVWLDATGIARHVFSSQPAANILVVGVAFQRGLIPVSLAGIERAIELNGVAVEVNLQAFTLGRRLAVEPELLAHLAADVNQPKTVEPPALSAELMKLSRSIVGDNESPATELAEVLAWRLPQLEAYQDIAYAQTYARFVAEVRRAEQGWVGEQTLFSEQVARNLYKLMAYKDEYEVARLAMGSDIAAKARARFGPNAKVLFQLEPPTMKAAGIDRKVGVPEAAARRLFDGLGRSKKLRGKRFDPFGRSAERVAERQLIDDYQGLVQQVLATIGDHPDQRRYQQAIDLVSLVDQVRGFAEVKMSNLERYRTEVADAVDTFTAST